MTTKQQEVDIFWCFNEHSQVSELVRTYDWASTSLGPIERWPMALKVTLSVCLNSRFPMALWVGQDLTRIYNDAYIPWMGKKHPHALCKPGIVSCAEFWDIIGMSLQSVLDTGLATWCSDQLLLLNRNNYIEESYWTYSNSPIFNEQRVPVGVFSAVEETTARFIGERRLRTLQQLSADMSAIETTEAVASASERVLIQNPYDVPFMALYLFSDDDSHHLHLNGAMHVARNQALLPKVVDTAATGTASDAFSTQLRTCIQRAATGSHAHIEMTLPAELQLELPAGIARPTTAIVLPLLWLAAMKRDDGDSNSSKDVATALGAIVLGVNARKKPEENYRAFVNLVASSITAALVTARDYEREKKRAEALVELNRAKTTFFNNISHEFRTPLTLMLGPLKDVLEHIADGALSDEQRASLERVLRNGHRLLKLVNTLLDFSRIEAGRMHAKFRPVVNLAAITVDLCSLFRSLCARAALEYVVDCQPLHQEVYVDLEMWEQIVTNLLGNAFKYTLRGSIRVELAESSDGAGMTLRVCDTGCGIPESELGHIFERFYRVSGSKGRTGEGSGIGLALLVELVKLHGGKVGVESEVGRGSTFSVSLPYGSAHLPVDQVSSEPVAAMDPSSTSSKEVHPVLDWWMQAEHPDAAAAQGTVAPPENGARHEAELHAQQHIPARLLVADDNADMLSYVLRILRDAGYDVATAADGEAALNALLAADPPIELVVSDIMMPRLDGKQLVRAMRSHEHIKNTPVILVSARAGEEERSDGIAAGADDYLVKPFSCRELLARVAARVELSRERKRAALKEHELRRVAESANAAKDHFIAVLSHELRTPLVPALMLAEVAEQDASLPVAVRRDMGLIVQNIRLEVELINDLLDVTRIRQKKLVLRKELVDVHALMRHTAELYRHQMLERKLHYKMGLKADNAIVSGDATRLQQVFWNILGNGVKFTPSGGEISVNTEASDNHIVVNIRDTGIGIDAQVLPRIFDAWEQGGEETPISFGGLGLGLNIAKNLVNLHEGTICAQSEGRGKGATFTVTLPLVAAHVPLANSNSVAEDAAAKGASVASGPRQMLPGLRVLVVEDNAASMLVLARILERLGCKVLCATSVAEAHKLLSTDGQLIDVLISDIGLPDGSGHDVMRAARKFVPKLRGGIALSGFGSDDDVQNSLNAGFARHLTKPARVRELQSALSELAKFDVPTKA